MSLRVSPPRNSHIELNLTIGRMCASLPPDPSTDIFKQRSTDNEENGSGVHTCRPVSAEQKVKHSRAPLVLYISTARWRQISPAMVMSAPVRFHICQALYGSKPRTVFSCYQSLLSSVLISF